MRKRWIGLVACCLGLVVLATVVVAREPRPRQQARVWIPPSVLPTPVPTPTIEATSAATVQVQPARPSRPTEALPPLQHVQGSTSAASPVIRSLQIKQRAVFITIDDGNTRDPRVIDLIKRTKLPVSAFLVEQAVNVDPDFWKGFVAAGGLVENHTVSHPYMTRLSYGDQKNQICEPQSRYADLFGRHPTFFRPPYGDYNDTTLHAVTDCGLSKTVLWDATYSGGHLETWGGGLKPGDIIILHFTPGLYDDLSSLIDLLRRDDLGVAQLETYLAPPPTPTPTPKPTPKPTAKPTPTPGPVKTPKPIPTPLATPTPSASPSSSPSH